MAVPTLVLVFAGHCAAAIAPGIRAAPHARGKWLRGAEVQYKSALTTYRRASEEYYLPMASAQSGLLRGVADAAGQTLCHPAYYDPTQTAAVAAIGLLVSGFGGAIWLQHLEKKLGSETSRGAVLRKTAADYCCWAPCANSAYLLLVPLLTGHGLADSLVSLQGGFLSVMLLEASMFMPYNLLAFNSIPAPLRPPAGSLLAACFTIGLGIVGFSS